MRDRHALRNVGLQGLTPVLLYSRLVFGCLRDIRRRSESKAFSVLWEREGRWRHGFAPGL